ncbi:MAG: hypothetical protein Tsb002_17940 [Wenzhouxiangellaceae bacterium]
MNEYQNLCNVFARRKRPEHFTDYKHCEECSDHDATLRSKDNDTISFKDVGNVSYSPISFISVEGFLYYLPGLARLAGCDGDEYFLDTFLIYFDNPERRDALNDLERKVLSDYLIFLKESMSNSIQDNLDESDLDELIAWLQKES